MKTLKLSKTFLVFSLLIFSFAFAEIADAKATSGTENQSNAANAVSFVSGGSHFWPRRHHRRIRRRIWRRRHWHRRHF